MPQKTVFGKPEDLHEVLLHACCAPCSSAIVEWMLENGVHPTIYYYNPNIWPRDEYEIRKNESKLHAEKLGVKWIDDDYDHDAWLESVCGLEDEPERGRRCEQCFVMRLTAAARKAKELGIRYFTTTLASSRWKSLEQIEKAGHIAEQAVYGVTFWAQNWRKGGLYERRIQLLKKFGFYNQQYCGCEFSARGVQSKSPTKEMLRQEIRMSKIRHAVLMPRMSELIVERLLPRLHQARSVLAYWPLSDEVDIRPLLYQMVAEGKEVYLPKVIDGETIEFRRYISPNSLKEGPFHILEPDGAKFTDFKSIDAAIIPGLAFDASGHRLGQGRGYYDRFLADHPYLHKIGVCFPFQRVASVPSDSHDILMDEIVS